MKQILLSLLFIPAFLIAQDSKPVGRQLFDEKTIGEVRISLKNSNWVADLDSMRIYGDGLLVGDATVDGYSYSGVGIRFRGNNSYQMGLKRNPYTIKLNYTDKEQQHQGHTSLKLSSALRDPSMVREVLFYEIARKYMPAPEANYTKLYVNNEYVGLYVNVESVDDNFTEKYFGSTENPFFKAGVDRMPNITATCKQGIYGSLEYDADLACYKGNFSMESSRGWTELQELTRVLNQDPTSIEKVLDVDQVLWMHALNNAMVNLSSYSGANSVNYYLYKDNQGKFHPIVWDLNLSFGSFKNTGVGSDLDLKGLQRMDPLLHADNALKPLISQLLKDPFYKKMYLAHLRQIVLENFDNGLYEQRAKDFQALIVVPFNEDPYKSYSLSDFQSSLSSTIGRKSKIPGIVELMSKRSRFLKTHPELTALPSEISEISIRGRGKYEKDRLNAFYINAQADRFPKQILLYYRFKSDAPYAMVPMNEESGTDHTTGVKAYSSVIDTSNEDAVLEFYFVVENAGTVAFYPQNYMQAPKKVKLSDLNK